MKFIIIDVKLLCSQAKKNYMITHPDTNKQTNKITLAANSRRVFNQSHTVKVYVEYK